MTTRHVFRGWKGGDWSIDPGYEVWLNDLVGTIKSVPEGISTERLGNGTLFTLPPDWSSKQVVAVWDEFLTANGLSEIDKALVQPMEIQLPPEDDPGPIPDSVPVAGAPTTEKANPVTAEDYRRQITGWLPTEDGKVPTYVVPFDDLDGHLVTYEGRTLRGPDGEKTEVMLTSIFHVDHLATDPMSDLSALTAADLLSIASWQIDALPHGARLEWHCDTSPGATAVRNLLAVNALTAINVIHTPAIGAVDA